MKRAGVKDEARRCAAVKGAHEACSLSSAFAGKIAKVRWVPAEIRNRRYEGQEVGKRRNSRGKYHGLTGLKVML